MSHHQHEAPLSGGVLFAALGLIEGAVWWLVDPFHAEFQGAIQPGVALVFFTTSALLVARFIWTGRDLARAAAVALALGLAVASVTAIVWSHLPASEVAYEGDGGRIFAWCVGAFAFLYILTPFAQIFQQSGRPEFPYPSLFDHSWNNFFVGLVAVGFTAALWIVLWLWGALFDLIGISFFEDLFTSRPFAYLCTFAVFGYGLSVGRASEGVIAALRRITLITGRALLPLTAGVAVMFAVTLPATGLEPLWKTGSATPLMLALLALLAVFLNAVFEDGTRQAPYPRIVRIVIEASVCLMPVFAGIALRGTALRVAQYGLTPQRVYALVFGIVAMTYAIGYAASVLWRQAPWIGRLRAVNVGAALVVAAIAVAIQVGPLDPLRLSAESQVRRIEAGRVDAGDFDFATLRFRLGHYGWAALQRLERMQDHPQYTKIARAIQKVREATNYWEISGGRGSDEPAGLQYEVLPRGIAAPDSLAQRLERDREVLGCGMCVTPGYCALLAADLTGDGESEFCLVWGFGWFQSACYERVGYDAWEPVGALAYRGEAMNPGTADFLKWYGDAQELPVRPNPNLDLVAPDGVLELVPPGYGRRRY